MTVRYVDVGAGETATDRDSGDVYRRITDGWIVERRGGESLVTTGVFKPSSYTGKISSAEAGTTFAIATGATKILFQSLDMAAAGTPEYAVCVFGTSAADAQANLTKTGTTPNIISTTGFIVASDTKVGNQTLVGIPANATHCAVGNGVAATVVQLMVTQGS